MRRLLAPGVGLMRTMRMRQKLLLVATAALIPLALVLAVAIARQWTDRGIVQSELAGAQASEQLVALAGAVQRHRSIVHRAVLGDAGASADMGAADKALERETAATAALLQGMPQLQLASDWAPVMRQLQALPHGASDNPGAAYDSHVRVVKALHALVETVAERSQLDLDPMADTYYLASLATHDLPPLQEAVALARSTGTGILTLALDDAHHRAKELLTLGLMAHEVAQVKSKLGALQRVGGELPGSAAKALLDVEQFEANSRTLFSQQTPEADPRAHYEAGSTALAGVSALHRDVSSRLLVALKLRLQATDRALLLMAATCCLGFASLAYLLASFLVNFESSMRLLMHGTQAIASGNLALKLEVQGRDELCEMARVVEGMSGRLSSLVSEIRNSASLVNHTGQQVSDGSAKLASRTDEQAGHLRNSVSAINDLAAAVAHNADAACELNGLTARLSQEAEEGHAAMQDTVQAMEQMRLASERVAQVVAVIDDVAFQTSMLSLNAAIEASRAGEAGRGFAIVANEVRQLAQRCADSAEQIRSHIGDASHQVQLSSDQLGRASASLDALVAGVRQVSGALQQISESSAQQSQELQQVTHTVGNLDEITRENAALVEESTTASNALVGRAGALREAVASMRLRQGSADEALAMVQRALERVAAVGREQAFSEFHDPAGGYIDRDLYIFAFDRQGVYAACGAKPQNVGQEYNVTPGLDQAFVDRIWAAADAGGGWVHYEVVNPLTNEVTPKESYILPLDDRTLVGCGIYRDTAVQAKGPARANAWGRERESALA